MKKIAICIWGAISGTILLSHCTFSDKGVRKIDQQGDKLYVCVHHEVKDSVVIPLSELVKEVHIVKLDTAKEALIGGGEVVISENYIGIKPWGSEPFKLYDKRGKFLRNIGQIGRGPGEYLNLYCMQLDEKNDRIYLLPWQTRRLLRFDFEGNALEPVRLVTGLPKGKFFVREDKVVAAALPFKGMQGYFVFQQTLEGKLVGGIPLENYAIPPDYSNEIYGNYQNNQFGVYIFQFFHPEQDTLYYYNMTDNRLIPAFTVDFGTAAVPMHSLGEFSHYYYVETMEAVPYKGGMVTDNYKYIAVDKERGTARYFRVENDFWGGLKVSVSDLVNGIFVQNYPAIVLKEELENIRQKKDLKPELLRKIDNLLAGLSEEDNNVIMWGEFK